MSEQQLFKSVTVRFFTSSYAPCMVQARIEIPEFLEKVLEVVKENGGPDERTALLSWDEIHPGGDEYFPYFTPATFKQLDKGWDVSVQMDCFDAASLYGYNAADDLQSRGVI